jgi:class 3 adenylate cyclase/tetratricopeptide (TPR) repeat protein
MTRRSEEAGLNSALPEERRHLTVMFSDLVSSTELASTLDPEDYREVLDTYQRRVAAVVRDHGGIVSQFQGDGMVAYFGYPVAIESAGRDAVAAGLALVATVAELGSELRRYGDLELAARVGVHSGEVVMATVRAGGGERIPDVWGEVPNLAARLQAAGRPGDLIVSDVTASLVAGFFDIEPIGSLTLKGIAREVPAFTVLRQSAARSRIDAGPLTSFVPRTDAASWLADHWHAAQDGPARLVLISGEPGIGKSRFLREYAADVAGAGGRTVAVHCTRRDALSPLSPFGAVMDEMPQTPAAAAAWVASQSEVAPLLVIIEDIHWADPSTLEVADLLSRSRQRILIVLTARPEIRQNPHVRPMHRMELGPLNPTLARSIVATIPGGSDLPAEICDALVERAEGVPLFLEELTRAAAERADDPATRHEIPATLSEVITARLDRLGDAKGIAQLAAIVGRSFERSVLQTVSGLTPDALNAHLHRLIDLAVVEQSTEADDRLWFRHALIHEAAYGSVLRANRRRLHSEVGDALIASGRTATQPEVVAAHLSSAERAVEATELWAQASRNARRNARFREAAGHERQLLALLPLLPEADREAVELASRGRLMHCLATVDQGSPEVFTQAFRILELGVRAQDRAALLRCHLVLVPWWQANADYGAVNDTLPQAHQLAAELGDTRTAGLLTQMEGTVRVWQGRLTEAMDCLTESYNIAGPPLEESMSTLPPLPPTLVLMSAAPRVATALGLWLVGRLSEAQRLVDDTHQFVTDRAMPQAQAVTAATAAIIAQLDGDRELTKNLAAQAVELADEFTTRQWRQWAVALRWWAGAGEVEPELPAAFLRPYFLMLLADDDRVDPQRSLAMLDEALVTMRSTTEQFCEAEICRVRGVVLARQGELADAQASFDEAIAVSHAQGARMLELRALTERVRLPGSTDGSRQALQSCLDSLTGHVTARSLNDAAEVLAV